MRSALVPILLASACSLPQVTDDLAQHAPPPDLGRPGYVRVAAQTGAIAGGGIGAVASIVLLPVTWPLSLLAAEPLGVSQQELMFAPVSFGAATGHFLLGAPVDGLDFVVRRAWTDEPEPTRFATTPPRPPVGPGPDPGPATGPEPVEKK
jgi:hypothetical protein